MAMNPPLVYSELPILGRIFLYNFDQIYLDFVDLQGWLRPPQTVLFIVSLLLLV